MAKPKNQEKSQDDIKREERKISRCIVSSPLKSTNLKSTLDFEWPEYVSERKRIKANTERCVNMSFSESMTGSQREDGHEELQTPRTFHIGDTIDVTFTKTATGGIGGISLGAVQTKDAVVCKNNLKRYTHPNPAVFDGVFPARVIDVSKKQVTVDVIQPVFDTWINDLLKDPTSQCNKFAPQTVVVENLQLMNSGFTGRVNVPIMEHLFGEPFYVDAFIPGSHIVLNIESDFEKWIGTNVEAFVSNFVTKPGSLTEKSIVCSRKNYLTFLGDLNKIEMYKIYCDREDEWETMKKTSYPGKVTGVINSSKKCGVFVEIPQLYITGVINMKPEDIVKYKPGQEVFVNIIDFEDMTVYDDTLKQRIHLEPYKFEGDVLKKCILKPVLKLA